MLGVPGVPRINLDHSLTRNVKSKRRCQLEIGWYLSVTMLGIPREDLDQSLTGNVKSKRRCQLEIGWYLSVTMLGVPSVPRSQRMLSDVGNHLSLLAVPTPPPCLLQQLKYDWTTLWYNCKSQHNNLCHCFLLFFKCATLQYFPKKSPFLRLPNC